MKKELIIEIAIVIVLIALAVSIYYFFFHFGKCSDNNCFGDAIVKCKRVVYDKDNNETLTEYKILGEKSSQCSINVRILQIKQGTIDMAKFEKKEMTCVIPKGTLTMPGNNLRDCQGELKEAIQDAMINSLHSEIVQNLQDIQIIAK